MKVTARHGSQHRTLINDVNQSLRSEVRSSPREERRESAMLRATSDATGDWAEETSDLHAAFALAEIPLAC